jgi:peptidoglycan/xylan/chitin deacetylase (PgdA/CDA1 family)
MKPLGSLSLDLDNKWSYMKTHGDRGWEAFPSYLDVVVPRFLDMFARLRLAPTIFVVGQDAALPINGPALRAIADAGLEIGNHSYRHEPWLHRYSESDIDAELASAEEAIERATGQRPIGFRGPGFSVSDTVLRVLARRGYRYDASTFPTFLGPLARAYYFLSTRLAPHEREQRKLLFGRFVDGFQPLRPYRWSTRPDLIEIPVTTFPVAKIPIHVSYVLYLSAYSTALAYAYFDAAVRSCVAMRTPLSLLLHPLDFLGRDDTADLAFFPAMSLESRRKLDVVERCLSRFARSFDVVPMREHAERVRSQSGLRVLDPSLRRIPVTTAG